MNKGRADSSGQRIGGEVRLRGKSNRPPREERYTFEVPTRKRTPKKAASVALGNILSSTRDPKRGVSCGLIC